jgi:riboflavin kinase / FMN adenylyltransferase
MERLESVDDLPRTGPPIVLTVGVFDGVHRGHQRVLQETARAAAAAGAKAVALTFQPHPEAVLRGTHPPLLCDPEERLDRFALLGMDICVVQRFDRQFAAQTAEQFIRRVADGRDLRGLVMTSETAFGRDRAGTIDAVEELGRRMEFEVLHCPDVLLAGERISSTLLRRLLAEGRLAQVRRLLGRRYAVVGTVVAGDRRGRELGYPTANLAFDDPVALPADGIYAVRLSWGGSEVLSPARTADGVAALGVRPTFGGGQRTLEVHVFDLDEDLYGERLRVEFVRRQRDEKKFTSVSALVAQMGRDAERARRILRSTA